MDLGFLRHKNPARPQSDELPFGRVHVFSPDASAERCTVALLIEVDPIERTKLEGARADRVTRWPEGFKPEDYGVQMKGEN